MPRVHKRKYEKTDEQEIDLVVQCKDSHEFYKKYREMFPDKKKGIDSISKIWKRRSEFLKKRKIAPDDESSTGLSPELEILVTAQNRVLMDMTALLKEHLQLTREILGRLPPQVPAKHEETAHKPAPPRLPEPRNEVVPKEPPRKPVHEKPPGDIVIGS